MNDIEQKKSIHLCLVSEQANPNLVPLLDESMEVDFVVLLYTDQTYTQAQNLASVLKSYQLKSELKALPDAFDIVQLREYFSDLYDSYLANPGVKLSCNVTGGTKPMSLAMFETAYLTEVDGSEAYYVDLNNQLSWLIPQDKQTVQLQNRIKLKDFLQIRGFSLSKQPKQDGRLRSTKALSESIATQIKRYRPALTQLNYLAATAKADRDLRSKEVEHLSYELEDLISELERYQLVKFQKGRLVFANETARFYCNGGWLEEYLYHCVRELSASKNIRDFQHSVELENNGVKNEIDLMALINNRVVMFECKTFKTDVSEEVNKSLYKLQTLTESIGGRTASAVFVSLNDLKPANRERAKEMNIKIIAGEQLGSLKSILSDVLSK